MEADPQPPPAQGQEERDSLDVSEDWNSLQLVSETTSDSEQPTQGKFVGHNLSPILVLGPPVLA